MRRRKRLRPNYKSEDLKSEKTRRVYTVTDYDGQFNSLETRDLCENDFETKKDAQGRWYSERRVQQKIRTWLGTFGAYQNGFFCSRTCGFDWARSVAAKLEKENKQLITYNKGEQHEGGAR